jgi:tetratricopeptide (TPR) repeat protein
VWSSARLAATVPLFCSALAACAAHPPAVTVRSQVQEAQRLDARAGAAYEAGNSAGFRQAKDLWLQSAELYSGAGRVVNEAAAHDNAGRAYQRLGQRDSALGQFGEAIALRRDTAATREIVTLLTTSPLLEPSRSVLREASYVRDARSVVAATPGGAALAAEVTSAADAVAALDALSAARRATLKVTAPQPLEVLYRRWAYRNTRAPWIRVTTDTSLLVPAVTYQIKYADPATQRDTTVDWPCADGCVIRLPLQGDRPPP